MAIIEVWIDTGEAANFEDIAGWKENIDFDWELFRQNDRYADLVSEHTANALAYLAEEVAQIGIKCRADPEQDRRHGAEAGRHRRLRSMESRAG